MAINSLSSRVKSLYFRSRTPTAFVLVVAVTIASIMDYRPVQLAGAIALLVVILQVLLEIEEKVTTPRTQSWYPSFQDAAPHMANEIARRLRRGSVRMRWIGVTQEAGWPFTQNLILDVIRDRFGPTAAIQVELALLDPNGNVCRRPDGPDRDQIKATKEKIRKFNLDHERQLCDRNSSISVYSYDHRPTWHALLIDADTLFYSTAMPQNLPFASPQGGVEVVEIGAGEAEGERCRHFIAWFESIILDAQQKDIAEST